MRGGLAGHAEVPCGPDQPGAEHLLPEPVDGDAGRERVLGAEQPLSQAKPIAREIRRHRWERGGSRRRNLVASLIVIAPEQDVGHRLFAALVHHVRTVARAWIAAFSCSYPATAAVSWPYSTSNEGSHHE